jgi:hypothetical protein
VYNLRQAKQDIDSIYSTGLFEDVNIVPQEADDSTETHPKVTPAAAPHARSPFATTSSRPFLALGAC